MMTVRLWQTISALLAAALVVAVVVAVVLSQRGDDASAAKARLDCAAAWLDKAAELHDLHLKDPTTTTEASQMELMDQLMKAYECATGEAMPGMEATPGMSH